MDALLIPLILDEVLEQVAVSCSLKSHFEGKFSTRDLFNCILVNRTWCRVGIPKLWRSPFSTNYSSQFLPRNSKSQNILYTLFRSLKADDIKPLHQVGVTIETPISRPLFPYARFLTGLYYQGLLETVEKLRSGLEHYRSYTHRKLKRYKIYPEEKKVKLMPEEFDKLVLMMLLRHFALNSMEFSAIFISDHAFYGDRRLDLLYEDEFKDWFAKTKTFIFKGYLPQYVKFFKNISGIFNSLERIGLFNHRRTHMFREEEIRACGLSIARFILAQKNLSTLKISERPGYTKYLIPFLTSQADSLQEIEISFSNFADSFPWDGLATCKKLRELRFVKCQNVSTEILKPMYAVDFPFLQKVKILREEKKSKQTDQELVKLCTKLKGDIKK
ncbi:4245_t:CDS:2 [Ambispora leptoticha]|uniref:4245_t:CDS:1 n=1 Tax=Ambispora leptoticha TaxID=144679 RepID=A0A9N9NA98_9GLOM|nr:4245_t:CDS:2 [Ambispora leptoticha]